MEQKENSQYIVRDLQQPELGFPNSNGDVFIM